MVRLAVSQSASEHDMSDAVKYKNFFKMISMGFFQREYEISKKQGKGKKKEKSSIFQET